MAISSGWSNVRHALANRNYSTYLAGRFVSQITVWMYKVAVGWMIWKLTHSATWLGVFALLDQAPAFFVMPVAGAMADRLDSLKIMRITQGTLLVQAILLSLLDAIELLTVPILIVFTLVYGMVNAAQQPASQAILPNVLARHELATGYGLNSLVFNVSRFIGPMLAGIVINEWGTAPAIFCNAIGATIFSVALLRMQNQFTFPKRPRSASGDTLRDIRDGFRYARRHPGISPTMTILSALSIMPFTIDLLLPSLADGVFKAGPHGLAWMTSMMAIGAMAQAAVIARRGGIGGLSAYFFRAMIGLGIAFLALSVSPTLWVALICIFCIGFTSSSTRVSSMTLLQYSVDADMRGRVASFYALINHAGPSVAALFVGAVGDWIGVQLTMGLLGVWTLGVWACGISRLQPIRDSLEKEPASETRKAKNPAAADVA